MGELGEHTTEEKPLPTIWRVPDELWEKIEPILQEHDPPKKTGRPRVDQRAALDAIVFRLRTGCQWNRLPSEFPDDSSVHRAFPEVGEARCTRPRVGGLGGEV